MLKRAVRTSRRAGRAFERTDWCEARDSARLLHADEQAAGGGTLQPFGGRSSCERGVEGAAGVGNRPLEFVVIHEGSIHHESRDAGGEELRNLRCDVYSYTIVQMRSAMDVGRDGEHPAIDVAQP